MAEIRSVPGTSGLPCEAPSWWRRFGLSYWEDWSGVLFPHRVNWSDFTLIQVSGEFAWNMGTAELEVAIIGLHARATWYWPNETREGMTRDVRLFKAGFLSAVPVEELDLAQAVDAVPEASRATTGPAPRVKD